MGGIDVSIIVTMIFEILIGGLVGLATYTYLHYLNKSKKIKKLQQKVEVQTAINADEKSTDIESVQWLNFVIKHWYLTVDQKLQEKIKELAQPTLDALIVPKPVTKVILESVSFGQSPPYIEGCRALRQKWPDNPNLETLQLVLGPRIESKEFKVKIQLKGLGRVSLTGFQFNGKLQVSILIDKDLPFPCIKHVYFTFIERPDINFDLSLGVIDVNLLPNVKSWLQNTIEELFSDSLVDPGRYLIDMTQEEMKMMLIFGVRKLKRTVLHLQIDISKDKVEQDNGKKRTIDCLLNVGGKDLKAEVAFYSTQKTCHVWYPIAAIQEEMCKRRCPGASCLKKINFSVSIRRSFGKDDKLAKMKIDVKGLIRDKTSILHKSSIQGENILLNVEAVSNELPYIPIRQNGIEVTDYAKYFNIPELTREDLNKCTSGLVYLHIHRATGLPAMDVRGSSDAYCKVKVNGEKLFKTHVITSKNPVFNYFEDFFVRNIIESDMSLEVMDHDKGSVNDEIGKVKIDLKDVAPKMVNQGFDIIGKNDKQVGILYITVIFRPIQLPPTSEDISNTFHNNLGAGTVKAE
ncbi:uncharacterized protein LOC134819485 [Bolinopsis microptera]|uniref:uncharacterized protein LOC134819485 n=1 Tax=Bolinopsis microptera TaxID=2820187 RepID=UPI00307A941B